MLTYSLQSCEKALVLVLTLMLMAVTWVVLVFERMDLEVVFLDGQIVEADREAALSQTRVAQMSSMEQSIAEREEAGSVPVEIPAYDNMTSLMGELDAVLSGAATYSVSFDEIDIASAGDYVQRGGGIEFSCASYSQARELVGALANGPFPCAVDSMTITDSAVGSSASPQGSSVSASLHVIYLERRQWGMGMPLLRKRASRLAALSKDAALRPRGRAEARPYT